jgi:transcriptional regulator with PAS, ATPase and Fis domain
VGHIASAEGGTFFLDEIGETTPSFQAMLLRLLEDGSYYKVGDTVLQRADVRILCATCRNLEEMVADGTFRQDLFYRIRGCVLSLPAVRQRVDFALLVDGLLSLLQEELALEERPVLAGDVLACLAQHDWPGNVRELRHVLHCAVVLAMPSAVLELSHFVDVLPMERCLSVAALPESEADPSLETSKMSAIQRALEQTKGNVSAAARMLGVARSTIYRVLRRQERSDD